MVLEEQRLLLEDIERLEQAIADRFMDEPSHIRLRLNRDHQISQFLSRIQDQSTRLLSLYKHSAGERDKEIQSISTGDPFDEFYRQYGELREFHKRNPNEPAENLEKAYKKRAPMNAEGEVLPLETDSMFTGEEAFGRFFDLVGMHEQYLNLPGIKGTRRLPYVQYLDSFDIFILPQCPIKKNEKMTDAYFQYLGALSTYLEDFMKKVRPLEDLDQILASFDEDFETAWTEDKVFGWETSNGAAGPQKPKDSNGVWCDYCEKEFGNVNVYQHHLAQKKHLRAVAQHKAGNGSTSSGNSLSRIKEKAIAEREFRIKKLAAAMSTERSDTKVNVERRQGMTDHERQQENAALQAQGSIDADVARAKAEESDSDGDERIHNPLGLPNGWDGKPIPFWLYKLHGLGVEFPCEICGNFTYMGRRAFEKHFTEARHDYGLKCLGIENTPLFREITGIEDALKLWEKIQKDKRKQKQQTENIVQMEDAEGNVMPEKVYNDLRKQGLL